MLMLEFIGILILIALSSFFSGSETAITSISRFKVEYLVRKKVPGARELQTLKREPHKLLITLLIGNNFVNITASVWAADIAIKVLHNNPLAIATGVMTFTLLLFGEILPKNLAASKTTRIALLTAPIVLVIRTIFAPLTYIFFFITRHIFRIKHIQSKLTEEDIRNIIDLAHEEGGIDGQEKRLIHKIFLFDDITVREIMIPLDSTITLSMRSSLLQALETMDKFGYKTLPVYSGKKIVGIFTLDSALIDIKSCNYEEPIRKYVRPAIFTRPDSKIDETLKLMRANDENIIIVKDKTEIGIITAEDIVEQIIGGISKGEPKKIKRPTR